MELSAMETASQPTQLIADDNNMQSCAQKQSLLAATKQANNLTGSPSATAQQPVSNGSPSTRIHQNNNNNSNNTTTNNNNNHSTQPDDPNNNQLSIVRELVQRLMEEVERETQTQQAETKPTQQPSRPNTKIDKPNNSHSPKQAPAEMVATNLGSDENNHEISMLVPDDSGKAVQLNNIEPIETEETKEMVMLRNLEISPPPPIVTQTSSSNEQNSNKKDIAEGQSDAQQTPPKTTRPSGNNKRRRADPVVSPDLDSSVEGSTGGRSKRQRIQTKLFQAGDAKPSTSESFVSPAESPSPLKASKPPKSASKGRKKSTIPSDCSEEEPIGNAQLNTVQDNFHDRRHLIAHDHQDVIFYEKNDYLAIRNEENSFYLCQLTENVRVVRPMIKVKWLDTKDDGKTYFLTSHYDKVPHKSIIMPVGLNKMKSEKKGEQFFTLDDQDRENIMERLKRSLNATVDLNSSQESNVVG